MNEEKATFFLESGISGFSRTRLICFMIGLLVSIALNGCVHSPEQTDDEMFESKDNSLEENYDDNDDDTSHITQIDTATVPSALAGVVVINGTTLNIPSKFSDISALIEIASDNQEDVAEPMGMYDYLRWIELATDGEKNGVMLRLANNSGTEIAVEDSQVDKLDVHEKSNVPTDVTFFGGIKIGQSESELLDVIKGLPYDTTESEYLNDYCVKLGDNQE